MAYSNISLNYDIGVLVGNFCGPSIVNVSGEDENSVLSFSTEIFKMDFTLD